MHWTTSWQTMYYNFPGLINIFQKIKNFKDKRCEPETNAKQLDTLINMEYENHQQVIQTKKEIRDFIFKNPVFCIVVVFLLIYALIRIIKGNFAGMDIIMNALILYFVYKITINKKKE